MTVSSWDFPKNRPKGPCAFSYVRALPGRNIRDEEWSVVNMEAKINAYYHAEQLNLRGLDIGGYYRDLSGSGLERFSSRPAGSKVASSLRRGDAVLTYHLQSFGSQRDVYEMLKLWRFSGISLHVVNLNVVFEPGPGDPYFVLMDGLEKMHEAIDVLQARKEEVDAKEALRKMPRGDLIAIINPLYEAGMTYAKIMRKLNGKGIKTMTGLRWNLGSLQGFINRWIRVKPCLGSSTSSGSQDSPEPQANPGEPAQESHG